MTKSASVLLLLAGAACGRLRFDAGHDLTDAGEDGGANDSAVAINGLVGWWKLDETSGTTAADSAGVAAGTLTGSSLAWAPTSGMIDGALQFGGAGEIVALGTPGSLNNLSALTVVAWIRPSTVSVDGSPHCLFDKGNTAPAGGWALDLAQDAPGDLVFDAYYTTDGVQRSSIGGVLTAGTWSRVAVTWDGSPFAANVRLYVDGVETTYALTIDATLARPDDSSLAATIGCNTTGGFTGLIDDVRVYDRALTAAEVVTL